MKIFLKKHKRFLFLIIILIGIVVLFGFERSSHAQKALSEMSFSNVQLTSQDRILILAPHPDDEVLACGGIIQKALALKISIKVVFLTYGDNNEWSFFLYRKHLVVFPKSVQGMGQIRHNEAIEADKVLGLDADKLVFLGYPDFGTLNIWYKHWDQRPAFVSMLTKVKAVPYTNAFHPGSSYKGEAILSDLTEVIKDFKPTKIFVSHPADHNVDHKSLYLFTTVALWDLGMDKVKLFPYLVHYKSWPYPRGLHPTYKLQPPDIFKKEIPWEVSWLNSKEIEIKENALKKHSSQFKSSTSYLSAFVKQNELFGDFSRISLNNRGLPLSLFYLGQEDIARLAQELKDRKQPSLASIEEHNVYLENGRLVLTFKLSKKIGRGEGVSVYLFGYKKATAFSKMPKIHIQLGALLHHIYDQNRNIDLKESGVSVARENNQITVAVPLQFLGFPERILTSMNTYLGNFSMDWVSWRILEIPTIK
ncbi:MAG: PIG-L family deacetylase [Candidatus Omnitrophica bacterium]|nr:PIG-L family deacetylase [Candidatus Omnitrophota bacterium]